MTMSLKGHLKVRPHIVDTNQYCCGQMLWSGVTVTAWSAVTVTALTQTFKDTAMKIFMVESNISE